MGILFSREDTVVTIWRKHEDDIKKVVDELSAEFVKEHCTLDPSHYTPDIYVLLAAFREFLSTKMTEPWFEAYMYNTSLYVRYLQLFEKYDFIRTVPSTHAVVGVSMHKWPVYTDTKED